ncbi:MAG: SDR family oxidoreductase [Actinomycetota bacterium]
MRIVVAGGHGQIARLFGELVSPDHEVVGLIRDPAQSADLEEVGMRPVVVDLEEAGPPELARIIHGSDALVFSAGAGPGSGATRKETVDYGAAVKSMEAAASAGVARFVMVSAMGTDDPPPDDSVFSTYLRAKARADSRLMGSSLAWTVVRPGRLTDEAGTGRVRLARHVERGTVPRQDVAAVLVGVLQRDGTVGKVFEVVSGDTPISRALDALGDSG